MVQHYEICWQYCYSGHFTAAVVSIALSIAVERIGVRSLPSTRYVTRSFCCSSSSNVTVSSLYFEYGHKSSSYEVLVVVFIPGI